LVFFIMVILMRRSLGARLSLTASAALLCTHGSLWAQAAPSPLEPVVVTARRAPQPISQVLADVTVVSREQIERQAVGSVADLLSHVAGFQISRNGGPGADGSVYLRGGETRHIAVLIDGVRVDTQNASGGATWQTMALSQIDHVEVVRGPVSALYGSDAISGVIQIFTRQGKGPARAELGVSVGDLDFHKADASLSGSAGRFDYAVSVAHEQSDGFSARTNATPKTRATDRDGYASRGGMARLGFAPVAGHRLEVTAEQQHLNSQYDAAAGSNVDDRGIRDLDTLKLQWQAQWLDNWSSQLAWGQSLDSYATPLTNYQTRTHVDTASWLNEIKWGAHAVSTVLEHREDTLKNSDLRLSGTPGKAERSDDGLGLGYAWRAAFGTAIQLNARSDWDSEFGQHGTGTVAAGQDFAQHWNVHGSWGTGYRAPTLYQRFSRYGNTALQSESSRNAELGVRYRNGSTEWGVTFYDNRIDNLIAVPTGTNTTTFCSAVAPTYCYTNTAKAHLTGVSVNGAMALGPVRLSGSVEVGSPKNALTDKLLQRRSRQQATLRVDTDLDQWTLGAQVLAVGKRYDDAANTKPMGGYALLNLDAQYRFNQRWRVLARVDNVGDKRYETILNYGTAPRTVVIGLRWTPEL
jgi:vitamin B12 transporter